MVTNKLRLFIFKILPGTESESMGTSEIIIVGCSSFTLMIKVTIYAVKHDEIISKVNIRII